MKCKLDIKYDIIDAVRREALDLGGFRNYSKDTLEISDSSLASLSAERINDKYGELILTGSTTSKFHYFIEPSGQLVERYFSNYKDSFSNDARELQEEEKRRGDYTEEDRGEYFQAQSETPQVSDEELNRKVKVFLEKLGVTVNSVDVIKDAEGNSLTAVAKADMIKKIVEVVEGRADVTTLPEEAAHFFVEMLGEDHPLYKSMAKDIVYYQIYRDTVDSYKHMKQYRNSDGSLNFNKLKKEAMGKLIAQHIIKGQQQEETTERFEKLKAWWNKLWNFITSKIFTKEKLVANPFETAAERIVTANVMDLNDNKVKDTEFFQNASGVDPFVILKKDQDRITLDNSIDSRTGQKRHIYYIDGKPAVGSVTSMKVDAYYRGKFRIDTRSEAQKNIDLLKAEEGDNIHLDAQTIMASLTDPETGLKRDVKTLSSNPIATNAEVFTTFENYLTDLVNSYAPGARFLTEVKIFDPKQNMAGSIDLVVLLPDGSVDIYDWKSQEIYGNQTEIKDFKIPAYRIQLGEYKRILSVYYGINKFNKVRAIPIRTQFKVQGRGDNRELKGLKSIEIGNFNSALIPEDKNYLLPVTLVGEKTEDEGIDKLITQLSKLQTIVLDKKVKPEERQKKREELAMINKAIRGLQLKHSVNSFINLGTSMINKYRSALQEGKISVKDVIESLRTLDLFAASDSLLIDYDVQLEEAINKAETEEEKKKLQFVRESLTGMQRQAKQVLVQMEKEVDRIAVEIGKENGIEGIMDPENNIGGWSAWMNSISTIDRKSIQLFYKLLREAQDKRDRNFMSNNEKLIELKDKLQSWAKTKGIPTDKIFNNILDFDDNGKWNGRFLKRYDSKFREDRKKAIESGSLAWFVENTDFDNEAFEDQKQKILEYYKSTTFSPDPNEDADIRNRAYQHWLLEHDVNYGGELNQYAYYNNENLFKFVRPKAKWETQQWKDLQKPDNAPLKEAYDYFQSLVKQSVKLGMIEQYSSTFLPSMYKDKLDLLVFGGSKELANTKGLFDEFKVNSSEFFGEFDPFTGESVKRVPVYYVNDIYTKREDGSRDYSQKSTDLFKVFAIWGRQMYNYEAVKEIEDVANVLLHIERNKEVIEANIFGTAARDNGDIKTKPGGNVSRILEDMVNYYVYGQRKDSESDATFKNPFAKDQENAPEYSWMKLGRGALNFFSIKTLALNPLSAFAQLVGGTGNAFFTAGKKRHFTDKDWIASFAEYTGRNKEAVALVDFFDTRLEEAAYRRANQLSVSGAVRNIRKDQAYIFQRKTDEFVIDPILLAMLRNNMVDENGNIVDITRYVKKKNSYYQGFYDLPAAERKALQSKIDAEIADLKKNKSLRATAKIVNDKLEIPGVDRNSKTVSDFRARVKKVNKNIIGNSTQDDINRARLTMLGNIMMQFRSWIPQMVEERFGALKYDVDLESYTYGKASMFFRGLLSKNALGVLKDLVFGFNDISFNRGRELYLRARENAYKKGERFDITETEYIDLYKESLRSMLREIAVIAGVVAMVMWIKGDDDEEKSGVRKYLARMFDKFQNEFMFYYSPGEFTSLFQNPFPILGLFRDFESLVENTGKELYGYANDDGKMMKDAKPMKYLYKIMPITKEAVLTMAVFDDDFRKEYGIKIER